MKVRNLFLISSLAFLSCACQDDQETRPNPTPGEDVQFGGTINGENFTRTIYGEEVSNAFPIYWVQGDQVIVASPQCAITHGTYQVPDEANNKDFAGEFTKIGDAGVQWGTASNADFYSVYPTKGVTVGSNNTSFTMTMPTEQKNTIYQISENEKVFGVKPNMNDCFMYAKTTNMPNGSIVDLGYHPLSTAIRFTLHGPASSTGGNNQEPFIIQKIVLHAPVAIAGEFTVELSGNSPTITTNSQQYDVEIVPTYSESSAYLTLGPDEQIELNAFIIPQSNIQVDNNWYIEFTLDKGTYRKNLGGTPSDGKEMTLKAGQIHRLPELPPFDVDVTWDPADWMKNIPRNVYLSEISIPGSWNTLNTDLQTITGGRSNEIINQYDWGVRAFHLDLCWRTNKSTQLPGTASDITDMGVADGSGRCSIMRGLTDLGKGMTKNAMSFKTSIETVLSKLVDNKNEYMVLFCTWAQDNYNRDGHPWIQEIVDICKNCEHNDLIMDGRTINKNTVVGDALGKLIVIIASEEDVADQLSADSKCLITKMPLHLIADQFSKKYNTDAIYNANGTTNIQFINTQSQRKATGSAYTKSGVGYCPTMDECLTQVNNILDWSKDNYSKQLFEHNSWMYMGIGGFKQGQSGRPEQHENVAQTMNGRVNEVINNMSARPTGTQTGYFPVGIILMNFVENATYGKPVVNNILQLNTKYRKAYDPNKSSETGESTGGGSTSGQSDVTSSAPGYSTGVKDGNTNAFGWTRVN